MTSPNTVTLAVDCMGGDFGPSVTLPACRRFLLAHPNARLLLVGRPEALGSLHHPHARVVAATEVVQMDDPLEVSLRKKKDSSMRVAIACVRDGQADAAVSAGNTGALMAIARYVLKTMDGIDRPAIAGQMPNFKGGSTTMLDLGANVDCSPEHLLQFALMGASLASVLHQKTAPTVGLLRKAGMMVWNGRLPGATRLAGFKGLAGNANPWPRFCRLMPKVGSTQPEPKPM